MEDAERLRAVLRSIDGRSYPAYRELRGAWRLGECTVRVDRVQGDPFAAPSRLAAVVSTTIQLSSRPERIAAEDFLLRRFAAALSGERRGSGKSGQLDVYRPGPEILERSAVALDAAGRVEVRFRAGLPARGRRVLGRECEALLLRDVCEAASSLLLEPHDLDALERHVAGVLHQRALREQLGARGLVGFVADGSVLPRASGISQNPMCGAVPFLSPESMAVELVVGEARVRGMGIPQGVSLIVGGGFHGKSTLLHALQSGHLDFVAGDGREQVVALPSAAKVRAEDGRSVRGVDISAFLTELPSGISTAPFQTDDASGSTSQAAAICEAVEAGAELLLIDEDTSATNLLVCDERMRRLTNREPITPLVARIRQLAERGVSTVLVVGGVSDYLAVADSVILMEDYVAHDATERAHEVAGPRAEPPRAWPEPAPRMLSARGLSARKIRARFGQIQFGDADIDIRGLEQMLDVAMARTVGFAMRFIGEELLAEPRAVQAVLTAMAAILDDEGLDCLFDREPDGELVRPRPIEIAGALNRLRVLSVSGGDL